MEIMVFYVIDVRRPFTIRLDMVYFLKYPLKWLDLLKIDV